MLVNKLFIKRIIKDSNIKQKFNVLYWLFFKRRKYNRLKFLMIDCGIHFHASFLMTKNIK